MSKILDFYKSVLQSLPYSVDETGLISTLNPTGSMVPAMVEGRRLVLPTQEWMRNGFGEDYQPFHPLAEALSRKGTSPVLQHMQKSAKAVLAHAFITMATEMLKVAADQSLHKDLPPSCKDYLKKVKDADKDTVAVFGKVMAAALKKNKLLTVYLKYGGKYEGKAVNRLCVIRWPLLELLDGPDDDVLGVKFSNKKHRATISALLRLIMPFGDTEEYSAGSSNRVAPYFHSFLQAYLKAATQMNKIIQRYAHPMAIPISEFKLYTEKEIGHLADFYDDLPTLRGNEGGVDEAEEEPVQAAPTSAHAVKSSDERQSPAPRPSVAVAEPATNGMDMKDFMKSINPMHGQQPQQMQSPYGAPAPSPYGYDPTRPAWLVGNTQQQQPQQSPFAQALSTPQQPQQQQSPYTGYNSGTSLL